MGPFWSLVFARARPVLRDKRMGEPTAPRAQACMDVMTGERARAVRRPVDLLSMLVLRFSHITGQTLRSFKFIIYVFIFLRSFPKTQSAHGWDLELVSGVDCW